MAQIVALTLVPLLPQNAATADEVTGWSEGGDGTPPKAA
jgi:hypothetical protein